MYATQPGQENSGSAFQSGRGVVDLHKQIIKQNRLKGDADELSGRVAKYKAEQRVKPTKRSGKYKAAQMARRRWRLAHLQRSVRIKACQRR